MGEIPLRRQKPSHGADQTPPERKVFGPIEVRRFDPENPREIQQLVDLCKATENTLVTLTEGESITLVDAKEWIEGDAEYVDGLHALTSDGEIIGFVWLADDTNISDDNNPEAISFLGTNGFADRTISEMSCGLPGTTYVVQEEGHLQSIQYFANALRQPGKPLPVITVYTSLESEHEILINAGFSNLGKVSHYSFENDDGSLEILNKPHDLFVYDLDSVPSISV